MIEYEIRGKMVVILGCSQEETDIELPDEIEGLPVSKIETNAFSEMENIKRIVIPGSVKVIGSYAFASCPNLETIVLEEGVESIEDWAFISCGIKKISLPETLKTVGANAFLGNEIKADVEAFMDNKTALKRAKFHTNNKCCVFPTIILDNKDSINDEVIQNNSKYLEKQFDNLDDEKDTRFLDVPILFDNDEFVLAIFNRKPLEDITLEVSNESKMTIGLYSENDPEYLILKVNVLTKGQIITSFIVKTPYLEAAEFTISNQTSEEKNGMFYYYLTIKTNFSCFGNGNLDNEFSIKQFDDILGKYQTQLDNNLISKDDYNEILNRINDKIYSVLSGFLTQIDGASYLLYVIDIFRHMLNDEELDNSKINDYISEKLNNYYSLLSDYNSLEHICFDLDEAIDYIKSTTNLELEDINKKYDIALVDALGYPISYEDAMAQREKFIDLETNYKLHGDFLNYIYKEIKSMNKEFSLFKFR
ncbi:MAG: leucine-rich repeat domain-containing protein [Anaeroplasma sp.]